MSQRPDLAADAVARPFGRLGGAFFAVAFVIAFTQINYGVGLLVGLSGQLVSAVSIGLVLAGLVFYAEPLLRRPFDRGDVYCIVAFLAVAFAIPAATYALSFEGADIGAFTFWGKRAVIDVITVVSGLALLRGRGGGAVGAMARTLFLISAISTIESFFFPLPNLYVFSGALTQPNLDLVSVDRAGGTFLNPNTASTAICYAYAMLALCGELGIIRFSVTEKLLYDMLLAVSIALTGSRAGAAGALLLLGFSALGSARWWRGRRSLVKYFLFVAIAVVALVSSGMATESGSHPVDRLLRPGQSDASESDRLRLAGAEKGIALIKENPIGGVGFHRAATELTVAPHNMFIAYALNNGLLLGWAYPALIFAMWASVRPRRLMWTATVAMLFAFSFLDHTILDSKQFPLLILGWLTARSSRLTPA